MNILLSLKRDELNYLRSILEKHDSGLTEENRELITAKVKVAELEIKKMQNTVTTLNAYRNMANRHHTKEQKQGE